MGILLVLLLVMGLLFIVKLWNHLTITHDGSDIGSVDTISFFDSDVNCDSDGGDGGSDGSDGGCD